MDSAIMDSMSFGAESNDYITNDVTLRLSKE